MTELKTLKDIIKYHLEHSTNYGDDVSTMEEGEGFGDYSYYKEEDLRQEAIKWVKEINNFKKSSVDLMWEEFTGKTIEYSKDSITGLKNWLIYFFNLTQQELTEEDLK
jgi:hypothetical protein